jgi:hypothetical protein
MERSEIPHDPHRLGVPSGVSNMISEPMVHSTQTMHLSCIKITTISKQTENELSLEPRLLGVPSGVPKMISVPMVVWHKPCPYLSLTLALSPNKKK